MARRQRKRGVSVPPGSIRCPTLVVYGEADKQFPTDECRRLALYLAADSLAVPGAGHWGVVYGERFVAEAAPKVDTWLRRVPG